MTPLIAITIAIAILSAWYDKTRIAGGYAIMHIPRWLVRAALVCLAALLFKLPWMVLGLWGLFSAVFRFALNKWRGLDWRYVSPSNWYDYAFLLVSGAWGWKPHGEWTWSNWRAFMRAQHTGYDLDDQYAEAVHDAGVAAYIVELAAFVTVTALHLIR
jgi:hypothetical protein